MFKLLGRIIKAVLVVVICLVVIAIAVPFIALSLSEPASEPARVVEPSPIQDSVPVPAIPYTAIVTTPEDRIRTALMRSLGSLNRDGKRIDEVEFSADPNGRPRLTIGFGVNDNFTNSWILDRAQSDMSKALRTACELQLNFKLIHVWGWLPLDDKYGNTRLHQIVRGTFRRAELEKVRWENFDSAKLPAIADDWFVHPLFR